MSIAFVFISSILALFAGMLGIAILPHKFRATWVIFIVLVNSILTSIPSISAIGGHPQLGHFFLAHFPGIEIKIAIDKLSAWFILFVRFIWKNERTRPKAQYTGRSFARSFGNLMGSVINEKKNYQKIVPLQLYPEVRKFSTYYFDITEKYLVLPLVKRFNYILHYFQFIQNGKFNRMRTIVSF